ncbi:endonuclease [Pseudoalteromonas xiamenensis]|uniref:Endonuclease n=1 Tax=Pseudoalteromonas xiamenensis TaxID=882626 RepID=A0A975DE70_9GAMM|nr:endonuclease [Pseudoalteromonas xiamenensis]QTH70183.1 endonuclease [Pseudoalteromonas xiamenensis]
MRYILLLFLSLSFASFAKPTNVADIDNFSEAKTYLRTHLPKDAQTFYCGCDIKKKGKKLEPDLESCGYKARNPTLKNGHPNPRVHRIEWEHIVSAWEFGHQLQCWQDGGRKNCIKVSEQFRLMEADIHNLVPAVGEVNGDRSNYKFAMLPQEKGRYGLCDMKIDFKNKLVEPPMRARKKIAEAYFYMEKKYGLQISDKQRKLYQVWLSNTHQ